MARRRKKRRNPSLSLLGIGALAAAGYYFFIHKKKPGAAAVAPVKTATTKAEAVKQIAEGVAAGRFKFRIVGDLMECVDTVTGQVVADTKCA